MFEIGWTELLVIAVVAIVVIGPKDLPRAMRIVGQWTGKMKRMAGDFQRQFNEAVREAELDDVRKEVESLAKIDPLAGVKREMAATESGIRDQLAKPAVSETPPPSVTPAVPTVPAEPAPKVET